MALVQQVNPIAGLSIAFLSIFISFSIMFAAMFIYKWLKAPVRNVRDTRLFWAFLMIAFAFQQLFFMINDFFIATLERSIWIYLGYGAAAIGLTLFVMIQETTLPFKTHGALTLINFILFAILFTAPLEFQVIFALILTVFYASILVVFARYITKIVSGRDKLYFVIFLAGVFFFVTGEFFTSYIMTKQSLLLYPLGAFFLIIGAIFGNYSLYKLPSFTDIGWTRQIKEIYIIHESGVPILYAALENGKIKETARVGDKIILTSGLLSGLKQALKAITQSKQNFLLVDQGDMKFIFSAYKNILAVIVAKRNLQTLYIKANEFLNEFYLLFGDHLKRAIATQVFTPAYRLIEKYFTM